MKLLTRDGVSTARVNLGNLNLDATRVEVDVAGKGERVATVDQGDGTSALEGEPGDVMGVTRSPKSTSAGVLNENVVTSLEDGSRDGAGGRGNGNSVEDHREVGGI
jgi:hypothetical protein